ncbi:MAG TPA: hypothetical protein VK604_05245 [Bryobacteraceae bacterium]|nr:hypothetical protein [Bryobacteraceae bacterium]
MWKQFNIKIDVSQSRSVDITLKVGAVTEQVEVQASATALDTGTSATGQGIDTRKVVDLPLVLERTHLPGVVHGWQDDAE